MRGGLDQMGLSASKQSISFSRRSWAREQAGEWSIVWRNISWSVLPRGQASSGNSSNQQGWTARYLLAECIWWILPGTNFPKPIKG